MFKRVLALSVFIGLMVVFVAGLVCAQEKPVLEIYEQVEVTAKTIFLGDVAKLSGFGDIADAVKNVVLGSAALPGSSIRFSVGQIQVKLRQAGFKPSDFSIVGASQVVVTTPKSISKNSELYTQASNSDTSSDSNSNSSSESNSGNSVKLEAYEVVVPITTIKRHEIITEEDLQVEVREGYSVPRDLATMDDLVGKRATRLLVAGTTLYLTAAEVPPVLERNDRVTIVAEGNGIRISTVGEVQQRGGIGDVIPVKNLSSSEIIYAEIISSEIVRVDIGGSTQ